MFSLARVTLLRPSPSVGVTRLVIKHFVHFEEIGILRDDECRRSMHRISISMASVCQDFVKSKIERSEDRGSGGGAPRNDGSLVARLALHHRPRLVPYFFPLLLLVAVILLVLIRSPMYFCKNLLLLSSLSCSSRTASIRLKMATSESCNSLACLRGHPTLALDHSCSPTCAARQSEEDALGFPKWGAPTFSALPSPPSPAPVYRRSCAAGSWRARRSGRSSSQPAQPRASPGVR